jgi:hypothetical protein
MKDFGVGEFGSVFVSFSWRSGYETSADSGQYEHHSAILLVWMGQKFMNMCS